MYKTLSSSIIWKNLFKINFKIKVNMSLYDISTNNVEPFENYYVNSLTTNSLNSNNGIVIVKKQTYNQATSFTTTVNCTGNESAFFIQTQSASTVTQSSDHFVVVNSSVTTNSLIICNIQIYNGVPGTQGLPSIYIETLTNGQFYVYLNNESTTTAINGTFLLSFLIV